MFKIQTSRVLVFIRKSIALLAIIAILVPASVLRLPIAQAEGETTADDASSTGVIDTRDDTASGTASITDSAAESKIMPSPTAHESLSADISITDGVITASNLSDENSDFLQKMHDIYGDTCTMNAIIVPSNTTNGIEGGGSAVLANTHPLWTADISHADWIWSSTLPEDPSVDQTKTFVKNFTLPTGSIFISQLIIAADNQYKVWINDTLIGSDMNEDNFTLTTQDKYNHIQTLLHSGVNTIKIEVTSMAGDPDPLNNPAGLLYKLRTGVATNCDGGEGGNGQGDSNGAGLTTKDRDHDGIPDITDNCPTIANPDQMDTDEDGIGDLCDDNNEGPVDPTPTYGPYCGDGVINGTDQCDLGSENGALDSLCTAQCQTANQCSNMSFAKVHFDLIENTGTGDMTSNLYLGSSMNVIPSDVWFPIGNATTSIIDPDLASYQSVPGLAVERGDGYVRVNQFSHHWDSGHEHTVGTIEFFNAPATTVTNDVSFNKMELEEGQKDSLSLLGNTASFEMHTTPFADGFYTNYDKPEACSNGGNNQCDPNQELIANGDFETPIVTDNGGDWQIVPALTAGLSWIPEYLSGNPNPALELQAGFSGWLPRSGDQFAELDGDESTKIHEDVATVPGQTYTLSYSTSARPGVTDNTLNVMVDGASIDTHTFDGSSLSNTDWHDFTNTFVAANATTTIAFQNDDVSDSLGTFLDKVSLSCVADDNGGGGNEEGSITINKIVSGGDKTASDFPLFVGATPVVNGVENQFAPGTYTVAETNAAGYTATFSAECPGGVITLVQGQSVTCTMTNTFNNGEGGGNPNQGTITVTKVVINDNGGTKTVADFPLFVGTTNVSSGSGVQFDPGTYIVSENNAAGYTASYSGDCDSGGSITIASGGETKSCTITNNDTISVNGGGDNLNGGGGGGGGGTLSGGSSARVLGSSTDGGGIGGPNSGLGVGGSPSPAGQVLGEAIGPELALAQTGADSSPFATLAIMTLVMLALINYRPLLRKFVR